MKIQSEPKADPRVQKLVEDITKLSPGKHSLFFPNTKTDDYEFLRQPCLRAGIRISIKKVVKDAKYGLPGVRIYRMAGKNDDL